jgi:hypothetical protein
MLTTLEAVKTHLGMASEDTTLDPQLNQLLAAVDAAIKKQLKQNFEEDTYTEFYDGTGSERLYLRQTPVQSTGLTVYEDSNGNYGQTSGAFAASTLLTLGTDYVLAVDQPDGTSLQGVLVRLYGVWSGRTLYGPKELTGSPSDALGSIKVTYTAGYETIPYDLAMAANQIVAWAASATDGQAMRSENYDYYGYTRAAMSELAKGDLGTLGTAANILASYNRKSLRF